MFLQLSERYKFLFFHYTLSIATGESIGINHSHVFLSTKNAPTCKDAIDLCRLALSVPDSGAFPVLAPTSLSFRQRHQ